MAKFLESEKRRLSNNYVQSLLSLFEKGIIPESEMDKIVEDIETLSKVFQKVLWKDLTYMSSRFSMTNEEIKNVLERSIYPVLLSEYSKQWLNEQILRNHFTIIERSVKNLLKKVLILDIELPEYITIDDTKKNKIYNFIKRYYKEKILNNGKIFFIKLHFNHVKTITKFEIDEDFKRLANQLFDFEINIIEKNLLKV
jgi:hypothetical protein